VAKRQRNTHQALIDKRIKAGRGQGRGAEYTPWLHIQDVPSSGLVHRLKGWKTQREHHFLSLLECEYFYALEWSPSVSDIREQYPLLPQAETLAIAQACGFRHPADPKTKESIVMTTDFVITLSKDVLQSVDCARTVKPAAQLQSKRTLEKLEIERRYWQARQADWGIVTEHEIPKVLAKNVELLHGYLQVTDRLALSDDELRRITPILTTHVQRGRISLRDAASACDREFGLEPGTGLTLAYHLLATRQWLIDMNRRINPGKPLPLLNAGLDHIAAEGARP
jgi:hypothetical protein